MVACPKPARFTSPTSNYATLAAKSAANSRRTPASTDFVDLIRVVSEQPYPRTLNVFSEGNRSFDLEVQWASGGGQNGRITLTSAGTRIRLALFASTIEVRVANWGTTAHVVRANIDDGYTAGNNFLQRVVRATDLTSAAAQNHSVPPFARFVHVVASSNLDDIQIDLLDEAGFTIGSYIGTGHEPVPVADARTINVVMLVAGTVTSTALVFDLGF